MAEESTNTLYVAREDDLSSLKEHWTAAVDGEARAVLLQAPLGGGKRAMVGELCRGISADHDDALIWRVALHDEEDGVQTLMRVYAGLYQGLHRNPVLRGKIEMALNSQIPNQPKRVQGWYQAFIEGMKKGAPKPGEDQFQVILPRDNPLIGIVEIAAGIARKFPVVLDLQNVQNVQSIALHALIEALMDEVLTEENFRLLMIVGTHPVDDVAKNWFSMPLLDLLERRAEDFDTVTLQAWGEAETAAYLTSKNLSGDAAELARIAEGRPGFIAELVDWLSEQDRLGGDLSDVTLANLADVAADADELEEGEPAEEGKRKHAGADDSDRVAHLAALLGLSFPSGLLADLGGYERESIDDLLDATEGIYKELQFSKPLGTWIYQFHKALLRESVLARHTTDEDKEIGLRVGAFMERFLAPRGYAYLVKTLKLYAEHGGTQRANVVRSMALGADKPQTWAMVQDLLRYFDDIKWPAPMRRTVYMHLLERMVKGGDVNQTEGLYNDAMKWATDNEDRPMQAWLLFAGSRLDHRRQDLYRARDRANDAIKLFRGLNDKLKEAEVRDHLSMIELADGNPNAAVDQARLAEEVAPIPPMQAHKEYVLGLVAKRERKFQPASEHFRKANEIAGKAGLGALALETGLNFGETLLVSGQHSKAADVLTQVTRIAGSLNNPVRERASTALLGQAHAALKNYEAALTSASRTLELTRALNFKRLESIDLYNVGFFNLMLGRPTEAVSLFRQSRDAAEGQDANFAKELMYNMGGALLQIGEKTQAADAFRNSLAPASAAKDWRKVVAANQQLATLEEEKGDTVAARTLLQAALQAAETGNLREERKGIRRKIDTLS